MAHDDQLWRIALAEIEAGRRVAVCTVIGSHGSTPRELGARMLMGEGGLLAGTVGGGCGEADVAATARKLLAGHGRGGVVEVDLSGDFEQTAIQACGGTMEVSVELVGSAQVELIRALARAETLREPVRLLARLPGEGGVFGEWHVVGHQSPPKSSSLIGASTRGDSDVPAPLDKLRDAGIARSGGMPDGGQAPVNVPAAIEGAVTSESPVLARDGDTLWFASTIGTREEIVIVGSGHVAQPLAKMASYLGYRVVVVDDRPEYTTRTRFPEASEVLVGDHASSLARLTLGAHSHVVIITRGHQHDESSLRESLQHSPAYVGMIGSKRRAIGTIKRLRESGFDGEKLARVHTPIGLDIGAQTPEEIALAVMAEIVCLRRGGSGRPLRDLRPGPKVE